MRVNIFACDSCSGFGRFSRGSRFDRCTHAQCPHCGARAARATGPACAAIRTADNHPMQGVRDRGGFKPQRFGDVRGEYAAWCDAHTGEDGIPPEPMSKRQQLEQLDQSLDDNECNRFPAGPSAKEHRRQVAAAFEMGRKAQYEKRKIDADGAQAITETAAEKWVPPASEIVDVPATE